MLNVIWLGALLLFGSCLQVSTQIPNVLQGLRPGQSNVLSLTVNTRKYVHAVGDRFLSFTVEPSTIFTALLHKNLGPSAINMAKALNPAYVRISGPECNYFTFRGAQDTAQSSPVHPIKHGKNNITITGWHWSQLNEFVAKTGLELVVGLNVMNRQHGKWDLGNTLDLVSYSDKHGYNMAFQLGNDIQTVGSRVDSSTLGKEATRLRKVLEALPRYTNSAIVSPDVKSCETQDEVRYLKNLIVESGPSLTAVSYQVPFASEKNDENPTEMFAYIQNQLESRVWPKDLINKYLGKTALKKPLWIVESGNKDRRGDFTDGLIWAQRLCAGARVGINTIMRKPSLFALSEPTPEYWVSVLHKALVGPDVLDIKISSVNRTRLETIGHCTKTSPHDPNEGILAPEYRYTRGAVTVFGVNMGPENVKILLKTGQKQSTPLHQYFLTANYRQNGKRAAKSLSVMLNGQKLVLSSDGELPIISPKVRVSHQFITVPSQCVFFFVLPDNKAKACTAVQIEESKELYKNGLRIGDQDEFDEIDYDTSILDQEDESGSIEKNAYVAFRSKYTKADDVPVVPIRNDSNEAFEVNHDEIAQTQNNDDSFDDNDNPQQTEPVVKYVTFSSNNWLSKFPKSLNKRHYSEESSTYSPVETTTVDERSQKSVPLSSQSRRDQYHILAQAVTGKRYPEKTIRSYLNTNLDSIMASIKPVQTLKLIKRSINKDYSPSEIDDMLEEFTNTKTTQSINPFLKTNESSSDWKPNGNNVEDPKQYEKEVTQIYKSTSPQTHISTPRVQKSSVTPSQTTQHTVVTPTSEMSTAALAKQHLAIVECHIQKIKSRKEHALSKVNERIVHKLRGRRLQEKALSTTTNLTVSTTEKSVMTSTKESFTTDRQTENENISDFNEKLRYNRQTNCSTISVNNDLKPSSRHFIHLKSKMPDGYISVENVRFSSTPEFETTRFESTTMEMPTVKTTKPKDYTYAPKMLRLPKPKPIIPTVQLRDVKPMLRDSRETAQLPASKLKIKSGLHPLGRVKTPPNVDVDQIVTNEKIAEKLVDNIGNGKETLQSEHAVSSINKNGDSTLEGKRSTVAARIKALEERFKIRRLEMERKLQQKLHSAKKRSLVNNLIEDDKMDVNDISDSARFESNELDVDVGAMLKRETIVRYPRAVADFTVKLNEVNTYVNRNKKASNLKTNEIADDSTGQRKNPNDIRPPEEENEADDVPNIKYKQKSIFEEVYEDDDYSKTTSNMMNTLFSHMQKLWKYIQKTLAF